MAQVFVNLPAPAGNGSGAAVDVSAFGPLKSVAVSGGANAIVLVETSNDPGGVFWTPLWVFPRNAAEKTFEIACHWMRATVQQFLGSTAPVIDVGGSNEGTSFLQLVAPPSDGAGGAVDVSGLGLFKTIQIADDFTGNVNIEVSEDGVSNWATVWSSGLPSAYSASFAAHHMRVRRNGASPINPGTPTVYIAATTTSSGGGVQIAAGTQTAATGTVLFANSNGLTFGMSASSQVTASMDAFRSISAGTTLATGPVLSLANSNGITFGISGGTLTASVQTAGGTASGVGISAGTQVATTGAVIFSNSNGITFGLNNQTLTASVAPAIAISAGAASVAGGTVVFSNSNAVSFGLNGSTVTASAYQPQQLRAAGFTATGGETQFTVTFAPAAPSTNYSVWAQNNGVSQLFVYDTPAGSASRSVSAFGVVPSASLSAGDQVAFLIFQS